MGHSALYTGWVRHARLRPRRHQFRYRAYWLLLDLDEVESLAKGFVLFSVNRTNLLSFHECDHGDGSLRPLRAQIESHLVAAGLALAGGRITLLCMPRVVGYAFNPLSVYFCHDATGDLSAILYEVTNTFGERHTYLIPVEPSCGPHIRQICPKDFYVSPFLDMDMTYAFRVVEPGHRLSITILGSDAAGPVIAASLDARRTELTEGNLLRAFCTHPLLTQKVIGAIHWQALKMWRKGLRLRPRPPAPISPVTNAQARAHQKEEHAHVQP